ncbi:zinc finger MYM-type protein 1-like [Ostrea edulis]|uniref:zinc finger MYM-type protein 1-like n=1 Tax=Ostrea edulis TaxID=37623 RepID=UPI0024AEA4E7|nr:zinc finger MYM-type protein 1-like [Ostrea edulis]
MACSMVPSEPNQPKALSFPKRTFGKKAPVQRSFQGSWFDSRPWLHYDEPRDLAFCHVCMVAKRDGKLTSTKADKAFLESGFSNWKDATAGFKSHEKSECHQAAVERVVTLPKVTKDVGEMLSVSHANDKKVNRQCLLKVLSSIRFIARQGLALRGDGDDSESNYIQLLKLRGEDDSKILDWIKRKNDKYTCAESQNEMLKIMALSILRDVAQNIKNSVFYSIMADETTDKSNREQIVLVIRHVNENLEPQEEFIGLTKVPSIDADTLTIEKMRREGNNITTIDQLEFIQKSLRDKPFVSDTRTNGNRAM